MTWVEVIDSVAKIGLGAVIGGLFSVVALRMNYRNDREKEMRARKIKTVEEAVDLTEKFFSTHSHFISRLEWIVEDADGVPIQIAPETHAKIREPDALLLESADQAHIAAARFSLLNAQDSFSSLKGTIATITDFRNTMMKSMILPSSQELRAHQDKANELKAEVQREAAKLYASL
ncbi:hypothetical protein ASD78_08255 [Lysobacter sp. Root667]|uniref:hypothetical protein n=1 Tax=Lysobacter sp. Root667 TaxID=1736581 RepID=UPI0006F487F7|nr:hypothetical protein [Lysobacter sp. Root667]KRA75940.1 hypothetical protein ASD78_08255 [Lysobacter sp. Root667]